MQITGWVTIKKCSELFGYTAKAVRLKQQRGVWKRDVQWTKAPDGRIFLNVKEIERWIHGGGNEN